jgi:glutamate/tyrosine decarboxylase-like PLP-dependent enzyme
LIRIFALHPHYSILKAAALVGLGNGSDVVHILPHDPSDPEKLSFDIDVLRERLEEEKQAGRGVIVVYGAGEVNTGSMGKGVRQVAGVCAELGAWLHVDAGEYGVTLSGIRWRRG